MEDKTPSLEDPCLAPGLTHSIEFTIAAFGQHSFRCTLCGLCVDESEDSSG